MNSPLPTTSSTSVPIPANEIDRLAALHRYHILDTPPETAFDRITALAARLFKMPIALVSLVDQSRAWFKSCYGFDLAEVPRDATLCSFALLSDDLLMIPDTRLDERFLCNPFVQREPGVRFYAGAPLLTHDGFNLGTLCLLDTQPRDPLSIEQQATLVDLAAMVVDELELRLAAHRIAQVDAALLEITQGVAAVTGEAFINALVQHFAKVLDVAYAYIGLIEGNDPKQVKTIATYAHGQTVENLEYSLQDTPCSEVIEQRRSCCYPRNVQAQFPDAPLLKPLRVESYVAAPFFDSKGAPLGLLGVMDTKPLENAHLAESLLTIFANRIAAELERQQTEATLRDREARFRTLAATIPQLIWTATPDGSVDYLSEQWAEYIGLPPEQLYDWSWQQVVHPEDLPNTLRKWQHSLQSGEPIEIQHRFRFHTGEWRWQLVRGIPTKDETGQVTKWVGTCTDIQAERESEERYRTLFESINEGFCTVEMIFDGARPIDYRFLITNPAFEKQTGIKNVQGKTAREVVPQHEDDWFELYGNVALTGEAIQFENYAEALHRWCEVHAFRVGEPELRRVGILFNDISDRKQAEAERKQAEAEREQLLQREQTAREEAERANRTKDEFLAVLSHELRSPLNPILGWTRLLQTGKLDSSRQAEALKTIERNAQLQTQLIEDLLDISRIMRGKLSLSVAPTSLAFVISAAVETVCLAAEAKQIQIRLDLDPAIAPISGDAARLQQVVWNLLSNAVKFTPNNGQVIVELRQVNQLAQIRVSDTGKGINPAFLPHVFDYFRQEDGSITRKFGGLGLGLAIVRQIVEMHGGTVTAASAGENQGATFTVQLPMMQQAISLPPESMQARVAIENPLSNLHILVVDDDADAREFQTFVLEQSGARVTSVSSGSEALQLLRRFIPDVLVSDIGMADMDGYRLIQQMRSLNQREAIPAIALTAYAAEVDQQKALKSGFQAHLTKPVDSDALVTAIVRSLSKSPKR